MRVHEFGFNVGGPIARDRAFFFFNYEEERQPGTSSVVRDVLTDPARRGDFSYVRQDNGQVARVNLFDMTGIAPDPAIQSLVDSTRGPTTPAWATGGTRPDTGSTAPTTATPGGWCSGETT